MGGGTLNSHHMKLPGTIRSFTIASAFATAAFLSCPSVAAQFKPAGAGNFQPHQAAPAATPARPQSSPSTLKPIQRRENPGQKIETGEHLASWLDHHSNLTPVQQQEALEKEPGFSDLPPQTRQRMRERLVQLNSMTPAQRAKIVSRTEAMERLTPEQRVQVRNTMQQLASLPPASRRAVSRTFRNLREMSPDQRSAYLNSPDIRSQFSEEERSTLTNLMAVEPYIPLQPNTDSPKP